jgi:putative NIF3 family GTP cyclohydrolase 1 type 2
LEQVLNNHVHCVGGGPAQTRRIGIVTGGAGGEIYAAAREGIDTFITGEAPHWAAVAAEELGVNLLVAGHYATETFGVKAFGEHLSHRFKTPWEFIDHPSGL